MMRCKVCGIEVEWVAPVERKAGDWPRRSGWKDWAGRFGTQRGDATTLGEHGTPAHDHEGVPA